MSDNILPPEDLNIEKIFQDAFRTMVDQIVACIVNTILVGVSCVFLAITVIGILAIPAVLGGYVESMIRMARGEKVGIGDFFKTGFNRFGTLLGTTILSFLGIIIGFLCLIIPGIYLMIRWYFLYQNIVDRDASVFESFKQSSDMVAGQFWIILTLVILIAVIQAIGGTLVIGTIVTIPYTSLLTAHVYLALNRENTEQAESIT
ncbi:MAG: hypothetical protein VX537_04275 [Candidatus Neomarinimicrobiota bacterium]|nr:hypothetical protein [Candidatus Neomarinimicrobiota bacterium]